MQAINIIVQVVDVQWTEDESNIEKVEHQEKGQITGFDLNDEVAIKDVTAGMFENLLKKTVNRYNIRCFWNRAFKDLKENIPYNIKLVEESNA